jgi:hypothetical protein
MHSANYDPPVSSTPLLNNTQAILAMQASLTYSGTFFLRLWTQSYNLPSITRSHERLETSFMVDRPLLEQAEE